MAMLRWDPWSDMAALQRDVRQLLGQPGASGVRETALLPPIDAYRTDEGLVVHVELPGMQPDDVELTVEDGMLTIAGERTPEGVEDDAWVRRERPVGSFTRSFTLPEGTDPDGITASFGHGMLELRIPHPPARKPRRIRIGGGEEQQAIDVSEASKEQGSDRQKEPAHA